MGIWGCQDRITILEFRGCTHFLEFKVIFLAPFNNVETQCTCEPLWSSS